MEYQELALYFARLEDTSKRLELTGVLVELFDSIAPAEFGPVAYLLQGKVAPDWEGLELGLAEKMILRSISEETGRTDITEVYHETGDLGLTAQQVLQEAGGPKQSSLFGTDAPTITEVYQRLRDIAKVSGSGSQEKKLALLRKLFRDSSPLACRYIVRTVAGRSRLGVADMTFLDALAAWHMGRGVKSVTEMEDDERTSHEQARDWLEHGYDVSSDLALVASTLALEGMDAVQSLNVAVGVPLRPMAAERLKTLAEILEKHDGRSALETKYDGLRLQCHVEKGGEVKIFSRRLEDLTSQFPDVQQALLNSIQVNSAIVEGEVIAMDVETDSMRPFQEISRRRGRKTGLGEDHRNEAALAEGASTKRTMIDDVPVAVFLFDCLAVDGNGTMDESYEERRERLQAAFQLDSKVRLAAMEICDDEATMESVFLRAVEEGGEGIMCKSLGAPYKAGNRGFDWIKYKTDYTEELVDTMDLVVIGAFNGRGRRAGWYGALLMACYNPTSGRFESVCKLGTGFDDDTLKGLKEKFASSATQGKPQEVDSEMEPDVWIQPTIVMEVQAAEITLSPIHRCAWGKFRDGAGLAARFPRFTGRWRDDKSAEQATSVEEMASMYQSQSVGA